MRHSRKPIRVRGRAPYGGRNCGEKLAISVLVGIGSGGKVDAISRMGRETELSVILHLKGREFLMRVRVPPAEQKEKIYERKYKANTW